jgi:hypothetical protein
MILDPPGCLPCMNHLIHVQIINGTFPDIIVYGEERSDEEDEDAGEDSNDGFS